MPENPRHATGIPILPAVPKKRVSCRYPPSLKKPPIRKEGGTLAIPAEFPAGAISNTAGNLAEAAAGEYDEWHNLYPSFAAIARAEGFGEIAKTWDAICVSEKHHEKRYRALLNNLDQELVFQRPSEVFWKCRNCGYIHYGNTAPEVCPACVHSKAYFELLSEPW